jgi:hypothetical protein
MMRWLAVHGRKLKREGMEAGVQIQNVSAAADTWQSCWGWLLVGVHCSGSNMLQVIWCCNRVCGRLPGGCPHYQEWGWIAWLFKELLDAPGRVEKAVLALCELLVGKHWVLWVYSVCSIVSLVGWVRLGCQCVVRSFVIPFVYSLSWIEKVGRCCSRKRLCVVLCLLLTNLGKVLLGCLGTAVRFV